MQITGRLSSVSEMPLRNGKLSLPKNIILPNHVALIPDGNRRWARSKGLLGSEGHKAGANRIIELARFCRNLRINTFTVWGFSTENWERDKKEVEFLMGLFKRVINEYVDEAKKNGTRIIHLGRKDRFSKPLRDAIEQAEIATRNNKKHVFNVALDYGGHDEIMRAIKGFMNDNKHFNDVDEQSFASYLDTGDQPYPYVDLLIRTSGEQRLSGFLPWQMVYAEVWWEENNLPDFTNDRFVGALLDYSRRKRRFGGNDKKVHKFEFKPSLVARLELDWWRARELHEKGKFREAFVKYTREQFSISLSIAREAADIFLRALARGETEGDWKGTKRVLTRFYKFIKSNIKLAFEPDIVASLEVEYLQGSNGNREKRARLYETITKLYAELFRIPLFQAQNIARLRALAHSEQELADATTGKVREGHLKKVEEYLISSYEALKERVA